MSASDADRDEERERLAREDAELAHHARLHFKMIETYGGAPTGKGQQVFRFGVFIALRVGEGLRGLLAIGAALFFSAVGAIAVLIAGDKSP